MKNKFTNITDNPSISPAKTDTEKIKKILFITLTSLFLSSNSLNASGIPVVDAAANAQMTTQNLKQIAEWAKEAKRWVDTTTHYSAQLNAYAKQLATQSGVRDVTSFLEEAKDVYDEAKKVGTTLGELKDFKNSGKDSISSKVKKLMDKFFEYDYCKDIVDVDKTTQNICYQKRSANIEDIVFYKERSDTIGMYSKNINKLAKKLQKSKDIKESSDLNNAIQAQVALMQAEKIQIDLYAKQRENSKNIMEDRELENRTNRLMNNYIDWGSFDPYN